MRAIPLVRLSSVHEIYDTLEQRKIPRSALSKVSGWRDWSAGRPDGLMPYREHLSILEAAAVLEGSPAFGLVVGANSHLRNQGAFGKRVLQSRTLLDALQTYCRLMPWFASPAHYWLLQTEDQIWFCRRKTPASEAQHRLQEQRVVMRMINVVRLAAGDRWKPAFIRLSTAPKPGSDAIARLADVSISFDCPCTAIAVPHHLMGLPFQQTRLRHNGWTESIDDEIRANMPACDFVGSVEQIIQSLLIMGKPRTEEVSDLLGCSVRSLQRRLSEKGVNFSDLVAHARFKLAKDRLVARKDRLNDIALDLGYADQSHFSRAFRRWAGMSPRAFRKLGLVQGRLPSRSFINDLVYAENVDSNEGS